MSELAQRTPVQDLVAKVRGDEAREQIRTALPANVSVDRFTRATVTALMQNPDLATADEASLFRAIVKCAMDGLLPDGREAAITIFRNNQKNIVEAQYLPMIAGVRKTAAEFGWTIHTHVIYENDQFEVDLGAGLPIHRPAPMNAERGQMIGAWARATHRDGRAPIVEVMRAEDIAKAKAVAKTDKVWKQWPAQMWEKTVGHRIAKKLALDPADAQRLSRIIDAAELDHGEAATVLYGPGAKASFSELPSGAHPYVNAPEDLSAPSAPADDGAAAGQPAAAPAAGGAPDPGAASLTFEPSDEDVMLAAEAAEYVLPSGTYGPDREGGALTLADVYALPEQEGAKYIRMLLRRLTSPPEYVAAVWAFAKVHTPDAWAEAGQARQSEAA